MTPAEIVTLVAFGVAFAALLCGPEAWWLLREVFRRLVDRTGILMGDDPALYAKPDLEVRSTGLLDDLFTEMWRAEEDHIKRITAAINRAEWDLRAPGRPSSPESVGGQGQRAAILSPDPRERLEQPYYHLDL